MTFWPSRDELYRHDHVFRVIDRPAAPAGLSDAALEALRAEDHPDADARVEDAERIAAILRL